MAPAIRGDTPVMPKDHARASRRASRRRFLLGAATTGAAAVALPQVSRAQTVTWKYQSTWSPKDIFHEFAVDYARKVNAMSGGRLKLEVLSAGAVIPTFQLADAVHAGILDAAHGVCAYSYNKHKAYSLFGTPPSLGWDAHGLLGWFYHGGGEALYRELVNDILKLNLVGFLYFPMPTQPLGWFKKEIPTTADLKDMKFRTVGCAPTCSRKWPSSRSCRAATSCARWSMAPSMRPSTTTRPPTSRLASPTPRNST
jgi:TRAP-type mannitol/chloroaromatic compound transport system substrate-binding protein